MEKSRDFLTGILFFGLLLVLGVSTIFLADIRFGTSPEMTIAFANVDGLAEGNEVRIDGLRSGKVRRIDRRHADNEILVTVEFEREPVLYRVDEARKRSRFRIASSSFLGGKVLEIDSTYADLTEREPLPLEGRHEGIVVGILDGLAKGEGELGVLLRNAGEAVTEFKEVAKKVNTTMDEVQPMAEHLNSFVAMLDERGPGTVDKVDETLDVVTELAREGDAVLKENREGVRTAVVNIASLSGVIDERAPDITANLDKTLDNTARFTGVLREKMPETVDNLNDVFYGANRTLAKIRVLATDFGQPDEKGRTLDEKVDTIVTSLVDGKGVLGRLLMDEEMAQKLERSISAMNDWIETQREDAPLTSFAGILLAPF